MIALWMLYATAVGCLLAAAALAAEQVAVVGRLPRRWGWFAAVLALLILPFATPARQPVVVAPAAAATAIVPAVGGEPVPGGPTVVQAVFPATPASPAPATRTMLERISFPGLARFDSVLLIGWAALSILLLAGYFGATLALAYQRRRWHRTDIDGSPVLIAPNLGPAVVGTVRQRIVLPAWSFALDPGMRALIIAHEREHLRARDPLLLHFVTVVAYLLPWNFPVWWMLHRLRLAIELDCDSRVLGAGFDARRYANLLLTVGSRRGFAGRLVAPALGERKSLLFRRIVAIYQRRPRFGRLRGAVAAGAVGALAALAWFIPVPARAQQDDRQLSPSGRDATGGTDTGGLPVRPVRTVAVARDTAPARRPQQPQQSHSAPAHKPSAHLPSQGTSPSSDTTAETTRMASASSGVRREAIDSGSVVYQYTYRVQNDPKSPTDFRMAITQTARQTPPVVTVDGVPVRFDGAGNRTITLPNGQGQIVIRQEADGSVSVRSATTQGTSVIFDSDAAFQVPASRGADSYRIGGNGEIERQLRQIPQLQQIPQWQQTQAELERLQTQLQQQTSALQRARVMALAQAAAAWQAAWNESGFPKPPVPPKPPVTQE